MSLELDWLAKATENLNAADLCLQHGLRNASVNRAYYAMFHAAIAALIQGWFIFRVSSVDTFVKRET